LKNKSNDKKIGYFHYHPDSNQELIKSFESNQNLRHQSTPDDWNNRKFVTDLHESEQAARQRIRQMLKQQAIVTADDFFRAGMFFQHSDNYRDYALAVTLFATSYHLGEEWAKNYYALAIDRFLLSIHQPQYFGTQFEKKDHEWTLLPYRQDVPDSIRKEYYIQPLQELLETAKDMDNPTKITKIKK
jgi:hypothetical protein